MGNLRRVGLVVLACLVWGLPAAGAAGPGAGPEQRLRAVRRELLEKRRALETSKARERRVLAELERIERAQEAVERERAAVVERLKRVRARAAEVEARLVAAEQSLRWRRDRLAARLRDIYRFGRVGYVDVLVGARTFPELLTRFEFLARIVRMDRALLDRTREAYEAYQALRRELEAQRAEAEALVLRLRAQEQALEAQEAAKRGLLARIVQERALYQKVVEELEEDSRRLEALIRALQRPVGPARVGLRLRMGWLWPARGAVVSGFGMRIHPLFRIRRMHTGVDIAAPWGSPVFAVAPGTVIYAGWFGGYGKVVVVDHGSGISTLYGHLSTLSVAAGDPVRAGSVVGRVGSTGFSTGPHLHFEVRVNGRPVNPLRP